MNLEIIIGMILEKTVKLSKAKYGAVGKNKH
jgi:hypothetical protein